MKPGAVKKLGKFEDIFRNLHAIAFAGDGNNASHISQTAQGYVEMGALDPSEVRKRLSNEKEFDIEGLLEEINANAEVNGMRGSEPTQQNSENSLTVGIPFGRLNAETNNSDGGPGSGRYPKGSGKKVLSAAKANSSIPDMSPAAQKRHEKHLRVGKSYPGMTMAEYVKKASTLVRSPIGGDIDGYKANDGGIVRYNRVSNDFAKGFTTGVATMYKPSNGEAYFQNLMKREGGTQDD